MKRTKKRFPRNKASNAITEAFLQLTNPSSQLWKSAFLAEIQKWTTRWAKCGIITQNAADSIVSDFAKNYPNFHMPRNKVAPAVQKQEKRKTAKAEKKHRVRLAKPSNNDAIVIPTTPGTEIPAATNAAPPQSNPTPVVAKRPRGRPRKYPLPATETAPQTPPQSQSKE